MKINDQKSVYNQDKVVFLGYQISLNPIQPKHSRAQGIIEFHIPSTKKELHSFLGLINFDRDFIPGLSDLAKPLYDILHDSNKHLVWSSEAQQIFDKIKNFWSNELILHIPDPKIKYTLELDASDVWLGCSLRQEGRPIFHISRVLKKAEKNYSITEKELLAAKWGMERLKYD